MAEQRMTPEALVALRTAVEVPGDDPRSRVVFDASEVAVLIGHIDWLGGRSMDVETLLRASTARLHDKVVVLDDSERRSRLDGAPGDIPRGAIGEVVDAREPDVFEVEFTSANGKYWRTALILGWKLLPVRHFEPGLP